MLFDFVRFPRFRSVAVAVAVAVTGATFGLQGCQSTSSAPATADPAIQMSQPVEDRATIARVLRELAPIENEPFKTFLARAEAALLAADAPKLAQQVRALPRAPSLWTTPRVRSIAPTLLASYARSSTTTATLETLRQLVRHRTVNAGETTTPGEGPAFVAMQNDIEAYAIEKGLSFDAKTRGVWLVGMPTTADGEIPNLKASVGVLTHADVVPATAAEWTHDPFGGHMVDDRLVARGALDDKGAIAAVLTAVSTLAKTELPLLRFPLLMIGTSEETHWAGIERFTAERPLPPTLIVADGSFPMGIGEKGITTVTLESSNGKVSAGDNTGTPRFRLRSIDGGVVANQVPATATAHLIPTEPAPELAERLRNAAKSIGDVDVTVTLAGEDQEAKSADVIVRAKGKAAHSAEPELGQNAIAALLAVLGAVWDERPTAPRTQCERLLLTMRATLGRGFSAANIGVETSHPQFGPATANLGRLTLDDTAVCQAKVNVRWPPPTSAADVVSQVCGSVRSASQLGQGLGCKGGGLDPFLIAPTGDVVSTLSDGYRQVFGEDPTPVTLAGTTYAKAVGGAVTFGPEPAKDAGGRMHAANEFITTEELRDLVEVYTFVLTAFALSPGSPATAR